MTTTNPNRPRQPHLLGGVVNADATMTTHQSIHLPCSAPHDGSIRRPWRRHRVPVAIQPYR